MIRGARSSATTVASVSPRAPVSPAVCVSAAASISDIFAVTATALLAVSGCSSPPDDLPAEHTLVNPTVVVSSDSGKLALPVDLTVDGSGDVFVLDWTDARVVVVPADDVPTAAEELEAFGRKGEGPGEFQTPSNIGAGHGLVRVIDQMTGRVHVFEPDGRHVESVPVGPAIFKADVGADRIAYTTARSALDQPLVTVTDLAGNELHAIVEPVVPPAAGWDMTAMRREIADGDIPDELRNTVLPAVRADGGVWAFLATESLLQRYDAGGRLMAEARVDIPEADAIVAHFRETNRDAERIVVYPLQYVSHLEAVGEGVWLLWNVPPGATSLLTVHGPEGTMRHRLTLPEIPTARHFAVDPGRSRLWLTTEDSALIRYEIPRALLESSGTSD